MTRLNVEWKTDEDHSGQSRSTADLECGSAWGSPCCSSCVVQVEEVKTPPVRPRLVEQGRDRKRRRGLKLLCPAQQHMCWVSQTGWLTTRGPSQGQDSWKVTASCLAYTNSASASNTFTLWAYLRLLGDLNYTGDYHHSVQWHSVRYCTIHL